MNGAALYWREPLMFLALIVPFIFIARGLYLQRNWMRDISDPKLLPWVAVDHNPPEHNIVKLLLSISWILLCIALAGPRTPQWIPPSLHTKDASVVIIVDFSSSMNARDDRFDRISHAGLLIQSWLVTSKPTIELGLVIFSGHTHTLIEPTADHRLFNHFLDQLNSTQVPTLGNNISEALQVAAKQLQQRSGEKRIIVLSDGDWGGEALQSALVVASTLSSELNIELYAVGIGGNEPVTVPRFDTEPLVVNGKIIVSRLQESSLKQLAAGHYFRKDTLDGQSLESFLKIPKYRIDPNDSKNILWNEWFALPLIFSIILMLLALEIESRRRTQ